MLKLTGIRLTNWLLGRSVLAVRIAELLRVRNLSSIMKQLDLHGVTTGFHGFLVWQVVVDANEVEGCGREVRDKGEDKHPLLKSSAIEFHSGLFLA